MASPEELKAEILRRQAKAKQAAGAALNTPSAASGAAPTYQKPADPAQDVLPPEPLQPAPWARDPGRTYTPTVADPVDDPLLFRLQQVPWDQMSQDEQLDREVLENPDRFGGAILRPIARVMRPLKDFMAPVEHGAMFGLKDDIAGLGEGVSNTLQNLFSDEPTGKTFGEAFEEGAAPERATYQRQVEQHVAPKTAEFVGSLASGAPAAEAITAARLGLGQMFTQGAKAGAVGGGLTAFGESEGDLFDRAKATLLGAGTGSLVGGTVSTALPAVPALIRRLFGGFTDDAFNRTASNVAAMEASRMTPTLMAASTSKPANWMAKASATAPLVGDIAEGSARQSLREGGEAVERAASTYGAAQGSREAGDAAQAGVQRFIGTKPQPGAMTTADAERIMSQPTGASSFKEKETALYTLAEAQIPQRARYRPRETVMMLGQLTDRFPSNPALSQSQAQPALARMIEDLTGPQAVDGLTFRELQALRTRVGEGLADPKVFPEVGQQELRALYGSLSRDLDNMVAQFDANGRATQLWNRANKYAEAGRSQFEKLEKLTGAGSGEEAFGRLIASAQSGVGKGNLALLNAARRSMGEEAWNDVAAGLMREMGQETAGAATAAERAFSPSTFMTKYAALSAEAKDRIFGTGPRRQALETLAQVFGNEKAMGRLANVSNSANQAQSAAWLLGGVTALPVALKAYGGAALVTKLMTSPKFARWVAAGTRAQTPAAQQAHLRRLSLIGKELGWGTAEIEAALGAFQGQQPQPQN